eukprot:s5515_g3.t1
MELHTSFYSVTWAGLFLLPKSGAQHEMELLDKLAIYVIIVTPLIMLSKPILPKVTWGYDFLPQMACHMSTDTIRHNTCNVVFPDTMHHSLAFGRWQWRGHRNGHPFVCLFHAHCSKPGDRGLLSDPFSSCRDARMGAGVSDGAFWPKVITSFRIPSIGVRCRHGRWLM